MAAASFEEVIHKISKLNNYLELGKYYVDLALTLYLTNFSADTNLFIRQKTHWFLAGQVFERRQNRQTDGRFGFVKGV